MRQKHRAWSGSHMVNTKANHRGYPLQNWWAHYKGCALCSLTSHQSLNQQAEKENWVWYALSARRREGLLGYGGWKWLTHHPSPPAATTADYFPGDEAATAHTGRTPWPRNAYPRRTTPAPFPNLPSAPTTKKIASSQFGARHTFNILACYWGMYYC